MIITDVDGTRYRAVRTLCFTAVTTYLVANYQTRAPALVVLRWGYQRSPAAGRARAGSQRALPAVRGRLLADDLDLWHVGRVDFRYTAVL